MIRQDYKEKEGDGFTQPKNNNNAPSSGLCQALLMESFGPPMVNFEDIDLACSTFIAVKNAAPVVHAFSVHSDGRLKHFQHDVKSFTGWRADDLPQPDPTTTVVDIVCGVSNNAVTLFVSCANLKVYSITSNAAGIGGKVQSFFESEWVTVGSYPPPGKKTVTRQQVALSAEFQLYASYDLGDKSTVWSINQKTSEWTVLTDTPKHVYNINGTVGGLFVGRSNSKNNAWHIDFYSAKDNSKTEYHKSTSRKPFKVLPSTINGSDDTVYALHDDNKVWKFEKGISSGSELFSSKLKFTDIAVIANQPDDDGNELDLIAGVTKDGEVYTVLRSLKGIGTPIKMAVNVKSITGSSFRNATNQQVTSAFFGITLTKMEIIEMQPTSLSSIERTKVTTPAPVPTKQAQLGKDVITGVHAGGVNLFTLYDGRVQRYFRDSDRDYFTALWEFEENTPPSKVVSLATVTNSDGRLFVFALDSQNYVWKTLFGPGQQWTKVGTFNDYHTTGPFSLVAGKIFGEVTLLGITSNDVLLIPLDEGEKWKPQLTSKYDGITGASFGATSWGEGFYVSAFNLEGEKAYGHVDYYQLVNGRTDLFELKDSYPRTQSDKVSNLYQACFGTSDKEDQVFAIRGTVLVYLTPNSVQGVPVHTSNATVDVSVYQNGDQTELLVQYDNITSAITVMTSPGVFDLKTYFVGYTTTSTAINASLVFGVNVFGRPVEMRKHRFSDIRSYTAMSVQYKSNDNTAELETFKSWTSNFTTADKNGVPTPKTTVHVRPLEDNVEVQINGRIIVLNKDDPELTLRTNERGVASVVTVATTLHAPVWCFRTDYHPKDTATVIAPNSEEQLIMSTIDTNGLQTATKPNGDNLFQNGLPDQEFTDSLNETARIALTQPETTKVDLTAIHHSRTRSTVTRSVRQSKAHDLLRLCPDVCASTNFHISYIVNDDGTRRVGYKKGTREEILARKTKKEAEKTLPTFNGTYAELMQSANNGFSQLQEVFYTSPTTEEIATFGVGGIGNFFKTTVHVVVGAVEYAWNGIVEFVEDVMHTAQSLFSHLVVWFKDLFEWLGSLFAWDDILQTQQVLKDMILQMANDAPDNMTSAGVFLKDQLFNPKNIDNPPTPTPEQLNTTGDDMADQANDDLQKTGYKGKSGEDETSTVYGDDPQGNWLVDLVTAQLKVIPMPNAFSPTPAMMASIKELTVIVGEVSGDVGGGVVSTVQSIVQEVFDKGTSINFADMLSLITGTIKELSASVEGSMDAIFTQFGIIMKEAILGTDQPIQLPVISTLYKTFINPGHDLTLLDLATLLVAIPSTIAAKLLNVFDDTMKQTDSYKKVWKTRGLRSITRGLKAAKGGDDDDDGGLLPFPVEKPQPTSIFLGFTYSVSYLLLGVLDSFQVWQESKELPLTPLDEPEVKGGPSISGLLKMLVGYVAQGVSTPMLMFGFPDGDLRDSDPLKYNTQIAEIVSWVVQFPFNLKDTISFFIGDPESDIMPVFGIFHTVAFGVLTFFDVKTMNEKEDPPWQAVASMYLKFVQNFSTSLGEVAMAGRGSAVKGVRAGQFGIAIVLELVSFGLPGLMSGIRAGLDASIEEDKRQPDDFHVVNN